MDNPYPAYSPEPASLRLPAGPALFHSRARRFRQLAQRPTTLAGYLNLMADLAEIQHGLAADISAPAWPEPMPGGPPLDIFRRPGESGWQGILREILRSATAGEGALAAALNRLPKASASDWEHWADGLLRAEFQDLEPAAAPFLGAALQVPWTLAAARLDPGAVDLPAAGFRCPVCAALPVASLLRSGGEAHGLRYLCCALCATEWRRVRIHCIHCGGSRGVAYYGIEGAGAAIKAEACADCKCYLKVMDREKEPAADPWADDIASLALDVLMAEQGYQRLGFNPLLLPGS